jgi:hypothetical protein
MNRTKWYQKPVYLLVALALLAGIPFMPRAAASPDQATFYSRPSDGHVSYRGGNYSVVHGASSGGVTNTTQWLLVGQYWDKVAFSIFRGALFFDTSSLPDDATISSAVLSLYGNEDDSYEEFEITVVDGSGLNEPLVGVDYGNLRSQTVSGGSFDTSGFSTSGYNDIPLNETGIGWISKTGITKLGLRSSRDIAATEPGGGEYVLVYASEKGVGYQPKLAVTYTTPPPPPVGGEAYPVSKASLLAPWIAVGAVLAGGISCSVLRRRRARS